MQQAPNIASTEAPLYRNYYTDEVKSDGFNLLSKYTKALSATSEYSVQTYYDYANRDENLYGLSSETFDVDFQHQLIIGQNHNIVWGLGYRYIQDELGSSPILESSEASSTNTDLWSAFIRDEIMLVKDELWLTLASRFEQNDYTGFEVQPNIRLRWQLDTRNSVWTSIARAVRTPSRLENNISANALNIPPSDVAPLVKVWVSGNDNFESEEMVSYEIGYRFIPASQWSFDTTVFYNDYGKLRSVSESDSTIDFSTFPNYISQYVLFGNSLDGYNYGVELSSLWVATHSLQLRANYSFIQSEFGGSLNQNTDAPEHMLSTIIDWNITDNIDVNFVWRFIDNNNVISQNGTSMKTIPSYHSVDIGLRWMVTPDISLSAFGKNLLHPTHLEYEGESLQFPYRVGPSYFVKATLSF